MARGRTFCPRKLRESFGLNQTQFWNRVGVTQSGGSRYEAGSKRMQRVIPKPVQMLIALAYGKPADSRKCLKLLRS